MLCKGVCPFPPDMEIPRYIYIYIYILIIVFIIVDLKIT